MPDAEIRLIEFSELIAGYTKDFVGREWLVNQVDDLLDDANCRFVVLTGGAGVGKSAFMAHLAATHPGWPRYFIRRDSRELLRPGDAKTFLLTVGGQLATLYRHLFKPDRLEVVARQRIGDVEANGEAVAVYIKELQASPFTDVAIQADQEIQRVSGKATAVEIGRLVAEPRQMSMQDLQCLGLLDPAWLLYQTDPEARIVVLVDALDELRYSPAEEDLLRALCEMPVGLTSPEGPKAGRPDTKLPEIPPNLRFVVASRREKFLDRLLGRSDTRELPLAVQAEENLADLRTYARTRLPHDGLEPALAQEKTTKEKFVADLLGKAAGNFLYLRSVLDALHEALPDPSKRDRLHSLLRVEDLPDDLDALYDYFLASIVDWVRKSGFGDAVWRQHLRPLLGTLAVAREPLSEQQLIVFTGLDSEDLGDLLRELRQFVELVNGRRAYRIYHTSFSEYLLDAASNVDYRVEASKAHRRVADALICRYSELGWTGDGGVDETFLYALDHILHHALRSEYKPDELGKHLERILVDDFYDSRLRQAGWHMPLVRDLEQVADEAPGQVVTPAIRVLRGKGRNSLVNQALVRLLRRVRPNLPPQPPKKAWDYRTDVVLTRPTSTTDWRLDEAIALLGPPSKQPVKDEAVDRLFKLANGCKDNRVKGAIALALGETGNPYAIEPLLKLLFHVKKRGDPHVSWCAADGLVSLPLDPAQEEDLFDALTTALESTCIKDGTRHRILYAIARRGIRPEFDRALDLAEKGIERWGGWGRGRSIDLAWLWLPPDDPERQKWVDELVPILSGILGPTSEDSRPFEPTTANEWMLKRAVTVLGRIGPVSLKPMFEDLLIDLDDADHWPVPDSRAQERRRAELRRATERALGDLAQRFSA